MRSELKAKWVEALRSGKYLQGYGVLHHKAHNTFCCLGVLCDVAGFQSASRLYITDRDKGRVLVDGGMQERLSNMNDDGKTFPEIADYIEANL